MNSLANDGDTIPSMGRQDSVLIAYDDLRKVNSKIVEFEYEKDINKHLKTVIVNDSVAIDGLKRKIQKDKTVYTEKIKNIKKQRNIAGGIGIVAIVLLVISIL